MPKTTYLLKRLRHVVGVAWRFVGTSTFFWIITGLFVLQALWVVWSGAYSMAYDEFFHLAAIQEYAKHLLPVATESAAHPELGAFSRDASFLYHYLMSFPYRLISSVFHGLTGQMIALRVINTGLFAGGIYLFWRTLRVAGIAKRAANILMLFFMLVPTTVMVAAQLNYDNMVFLFAGATLFLATDYVLGLRRGSLPSIPRLLTLIALLFSGSVVKYAFLPIALSVGALLLVETVLAFRHGRLSWESVRVQTVSARRSLLVLSAIFLVLSMAVFTERIGLNVVRYHTPVPDCSQVISYQECLSHDAYARNEKYKEWQLSSQLDTKDKLSYPWQWYRKMLRESFFVVGPKQIGYLTGAPLPSAAIAGNVIVASMIVLIILSLPWLLRQPVWRLWLGVASLYIGVLFIENYKAYLTLGVSVAIHGRYVVPVIILLAGVAFASLRRLLRPSWKPYIYSAAGVLFLLMLAGGGWLPWIIRSGDTWMWPHAVEASRTLRSLLWHIVWK